VRARRDPLPAGAPLAADPLRGVRVDGVRVRGVRVDGVRVGYPSLRTQFRGRAPIGCTSVSMCAVVHPVGGVAVDWVRIRTGRPHRGGFWVRIGRHVC